MKAHLTHCPWSDLKCKLCALFNVIRGQPTMYRMEIIGNVTLKNPNLSWLITACTFHSGRVIEMDEKTAREFLDLMREYIDERIVYMTNTYPDEWADAKPSHAIWEQIEATVLEKTEQPGAGE